MKLFALVALLLMAGCTYVRPADSLEGNMIVSEYRGDGLWATHYANTDKGDSVVESGDYVHLAWSNGTRYSVPADLCSIRWEP